MLTHTVLKYIAITQAMTVQALLHILHDTFLHDYLRRGICDMLNWMIVVLKNEAARAIVGFEVRSKNVNLEQISLLI